MVNTVQRRLMKAKSTTRAGEYCIKLFRTKTYTKKESDNMIIVNPNLDVNDCSFNFQIQMQYEGKGKLQRALAGPEPKHQAQ